MLANLESMNAEFIHRALPLPGFEGMTALKPGYRASPTARPRSAPQRLSDTQITRLSGRVGHRRVDLMSVSDIKAQTRLWELM